MLLCLCLVMILPFSIITETRNHGRRSWHKGNSLSASTDAINSKIGRDSLLLQLPVKVLLTGRCRSAEGDIGALSQGFDGVCLTQGMQRDCVLASLVQRCTLTLHFAKEHDKLLPVQAFTLSHLFGNRLVVLERLVPCQY